MATTPNYNLAKPAAGVLGWSGQVNGNFDTIDTVLATISSKTQSVRQATPSVSPEGLETVQINWPTAFANNNYAVSLAVEDPTGFLSAGSFTYLANGAGILVRISNQDTTQSHSGYLHATATAFS